MTKMFVKRDETDAVSNDTRDKSLGIFLPSKLYSMQLSYCLKLTIEQCQHLGDRLPEGSVFVGLR